MNAHVCPVPRQALCPIPDVQSRVRSAPVAVTTSAAAGRIFSASTRRMAEVAAHLTDHVLPHLPVRQWMLSLPKRLRPHLHHNQEIAGTVLRIFLRAIEEGELDDIDPVGNLGGKPRARSGSEITIISLQERSTATGRHQPRAFAPQHWARVRGAGFWWCGTRSC